MNEARDQHTAQLVRRLDSIEKALARAGLIDDFEVFRRPPIPYDPHPIDYVRLDRDVYRQRLEEFFKRRWGWVADPPPEDILNVAILDLARHIGGGVTDPSPEDIVNLKIKDLIGMIPGGGVTDPPPEDISRFTKLELEARLHRIETEKIRLGSLENMLRARLEQINPE